MHAIWASVLNVLKNGKDPVININYSMMVKPEPKKPGRPKLTKAGNPFMLYAAAVLTGGASRPRCLNPKCKKRLKVANLTCGEYCKHEAIMFFSIALQLLKKKPFGLPDKPPEKIIHDFKTGSIPVAKLPAELCRKIGKGRDRHRNGVTPRGKAEVAAETILSGLVSSASNGGGADSNGAAKEAK